MNACGKMEFSIDGWRAWAPGLDSPQAWQAWSRAPIIMDDTDALPGVDFLPPMQRRRLSKLARMLFHVGWPLVQRNEAVPLVLVSRHGETPRTLAILEDLARGEPLSPTAFSLSVHNGPAGLWSITRADCSEISALAAEVDALEHGIMEACGLLDEGAPSVLLIVAEESPASLYAEQIDDVPFSYALALKLTAGTHWRLQLSSGNGPRSRWPHALELTRALCLGHRDLRHHWKYRQWDWSCQHH